MATRSATANWSRRSRVPILPWAPCAPPERGATLGEAKANTVVSDDELSAAIAEIESLNPTQQDDIPSLDDGSTERHVVPIPLPVPAVKRSPQDVLTATADAAATAEPPPGRAEPAAEPAAATKTEETAPPARRGPGVLQRLLASLPVLRRRRRAKPAQPALDTRAVEKAPKTSVVEAAPSGNFILRMLDTVLDLVNRPFDFLTPAARQKLGLVGLATIVTSILAACLLPLLMPKHDPVSSLRAKRAELQVAPPAHPTADQSP